MSGRAILYRGEALHVLQQLEGEQVRCIVTSPPYWGLRDYGTARWDGGDSDCGHLVRRDPKTASSTLGGGKRTTGHQQEGFAAVCPRCGARRIDQQLGMEPNPAAYIDRLVLLLREARRVLRKDGTLWLNLGDSYATAGGGRLYGSADGGVRRAAPPGAQRRAPQGYKPKDLLMIPARVALALQADGWHLRSEIIWAKPNAMPQSVKDRPTTSHEYVFLLSRSSRYFYDYKAASEPIAPSQIGRVRADAVGGAAHEARGQHSKGGVYTSGNKARKLADGTPHQRPADHHGSHIPWDNKDGRRNGRTVWTVSTKPYPGAHFATFPPELARRCIVAGSTPGDIVLDPFGGSGTTAAVAVQMGRAAWHIDLNYFELARERIGPLLCEDVTYDDPDRP